MSIIWKQHGLSCTSVVITSKRVWNVEENACLLSKTLLHKIFQHSLFQVRFNWPKHKRLSHLMLLEDVFPNHGEDIIPNCTDKATLKISKKKCKMWNYYLPSGYPSGPTFHRGSSLVPTPRYEIWIFHLFNSVGKGYCRLHNLWCIGLHNVQCTCNSRYSCELSLHTSMVVL